VGRYAQSNSRSWLSQMTLEEKLIRFVKVNILSNINEGMVLVEGKTNPRAYWEFQAEIWLFEDVKTSK